MGIPVCRFSDKSCEAFICAICLEVSIDPILVNGCQHIYCRQCVTGRSITNCPTCQLPLSEPKWLEFEGLMSRIYHAFEVKCLNESCNQLLDIKTYSSHDDNCPVKFNFCPGCNYKYLRGSNGVHSCSEQLRFGKIVERLEQVEKQLGELQKHYAISQSTI